jgi:hypothetical protein
MRSSGMLIGSYRRFGTTYRPHLQESKWVGFHEKPVTTHLHWVTFQKSENLSASLILTGSSDGAIVINKLARIRKEVLVANSELINQYVMGENEKKTTSVLLDYSALPPEFEYIPNTRRKLQPFKWRSYWWHIPA